MIIIRNLKNEVSKDLKLEIEEKDGKLVVSSRVIARELGKRHDAVLRDIENILKKGTPQICGLFIKSEYIASNGKTNKEYLLTKDGFTLYKMF
jgi:Rha family phage regulatory protein